MKKAPKRIFSYTPCKACTLLLNQLTVMRTNDHSINVRCSKPSSDNIFCLYIYEGWQKRDEIYFYLNKAFIFFKYQCYLQNSSHGQQRTYIEVVSNVGGSTRSFQPVWSSACPLRSYGCFLKSKNDEEILNLRKMKSHKDRGQMNLGKGTKNGF